MPRTSPIYDQSEIEIRKQLAELSHSGNDTVRASALLGLATLLLVDEMRAQADG